MVLRRGSTQIVGNIKNAGRRKSVDDGLRQHSNKFFGLLRKMRLISQSSFQEEQKSNDIDNDTSEDKENNKSNLSKISQGPSMNDGSKSDLKSKSNEEVKHKVCLIKYDC